MARASRMSSQALRAVPVTVLAVVASAALLLWPLVEALDLEGTDVETDVVRITDYRADFTVTSGGRLDATETITAFFPPGRHGIFRFWDVVDQGDPHVRLVPRDIEVAR